MLASTLRKGVHAELLKISNACCQGGIFFNPPVLAWNMANPADTGTAYTSLDSHRYHNWHKLVPILE